MKINNIEFYHYNMLKNEVKLKYKFKINKRKFDNKIYFYNYYNFHNINKKKLLLKLKI
jgi:hypothetical protein